MDSPNHRGLSGPFVILDKINTFKYKESRSYKHRIPVKYFHA